MIGDDARKRLAGANSMYQLQRSSTLQKKGLIYQSDATLVALNVVRRMEQMNNQKKVKWVAVSGGFDPIHIGHVRMFKMAKSHGDKLVVILNNDNWLMKKKGFVFMKEKERAEIIRSIVGVDRVYITKHKKNDRDTSVCKALEILKPTIFANGGDRKNKLDIPEMHTCQANGIQMQFGMGGGKIQSSSWLTNKIKNK